VTSSAKQQHLTLTPATDVNGNQQIGLDATNWFVPDLEANGSAAAQATLSLQGAAPTDHAAVNLNISGLLNAYGLDSAGGAVTADATASSDSYDKITNNHSSGYEDANFTINESIYLPSEHALVTLQICDAVQFNIKSTGFLSDANVTSNSTFTTNTGLDTTQQAATPATAQANGNHGSNDAFNLANYAANGLTAADLTVEFSASQPGESLHIDGSSTLNVNATVQYLACGPGSAVLNCQTLQKCQSTPISFDAKGAYGSIVQTAQIPLTPLAAASGTT
jgi:hypothetical protein